uniref:Uncharacterized protein n=1 Tax=Lactuca sativa TaxID=4236 RepID=A0A9R1VGF6_LACSA|nr:hypothetical protein LSAT_V11C500233480 [Lactuca sativa]
MFQARETLNMEIKEELKLRTQKMEVQINKQKLRKEMQMIEIQYSYMLLSFRKEKNLKMKTKKEEKLTRQKGNEGAIPTENAYVSSTLSNERKYEKFMENFRDSTDGYKKILTMKDIDMVC